MNRITMVEVSLAGAVFVVFMLLYWTVNTMLEDKQVSDAAMMVQSARATAQHWLATESNPLPHDLLEQLGTEATCPWEDALSLTRLDDHIFALRLCTPNADMAYALADQVDVPPPQPPSPCVTIPLVARR